MYQKTFCTKELHKNHFVEIMQNSTYIQKRITTYSINSINQSSTFISSKVFYFKKHPAYQVQHSEKTKFLLALKVPYCCQTIKVAVGTMAEPLHSRSKEIFRNLRTHQLTFFRIINVYQCLFNLNILFDKVDWGLGHENYFVRYHLNHFLFKTVTDDLN